MCRRNSHCHQVGVLFPLLYFGVWLPTAAGLGLAGLIARTGTIPEQLDIDSELLAQYPLYTFFYNYGLLLITEATLGEEGDCPGLGPAETLMSERLPNQTRNPPILSSPHPCTDFTCIAFRWATSTPTGLILPNLLWPKPDV